MQWFRHYHELSGDPKLSLVAQAADLPHIYAVGAWCYVLEQASAAEDRGSVTGIKARRMGSTLRITTAEAQRLLDAFHEEGMINDDGMVAAWDKRQRRSDSSLERVKAWREKKAAERVDATETVTPVTETTPNGTVTLQGEDVTLKEAPDQNQNQIQNTPLNPPAGGGNGPVLRSREKFPPVSSLPKEGGDCKYPEPFEKLWAIYPRREQDDKRGCYRNFRSQVKEWGADPDAILAAAHEYRRAHEHDEYRIGLRRWLKEGGYRTKPTVARNADYRFNTATASIPG